MKKLRLIVEARSDVELKKDTEYWDPNNTNDRLMTTHKSGPHHIKVEYTHKYYDKSLLGRSPEGHWAVDFKINNGYIGRSYGVPSHHKAELMRHLGNSFHSFMAQKKPKVIKLQSNIVDTYSNQKQAQYHNIAKQLARMYGGKVITSDKDNESRVEFPNN